MRMTTTWTSEGWGRSPPPPWPEPLGACQAQAEHCFSPTHILARSASIPRGVLPTRLGRRLSPPHGGPEETELGHMKMATAHTAGLASFSMKC